MQRKRKNKNRITASGLILILLIQTSACFGNGGTAVVYGEEEAIRTGGLQLESSKPGGLSRSEIGSRENNAIVHISDAEDFADFAAASRVQGYSAGCTFILDNDIDLSDHPNMPVPYLDGFFEGHGHAISGVVLDEDISDCGLFRYVGKNGVIRDLKVTADVVCGDEQQHTGIIAGTNEGEITGCTAAGSLNAQSQVGAIAGFNCESGIIRDCSNEATLDGKYQTGGIAGLNEGRIEGCINRGNINCNSHIKNRRGNSSGDAVNISIPNAVTGFAADERANETGGIAGCSTGRISFCDNYARVGYKDLGNATGGIAGRSGGILQSCSSSGEIRGRVNAGGIAGLLDPYKVVSLDRDYYSEISREFDTMQSAMDELTDAGRQLGDDISYNFNDINDAFEALRDSVRSWFDGYEGDLRSYRHNLHEEVDEVEQQLDDMDYRLRLSRIRKHEKQIREDIEEMDGYLGELADMLEKLDADTAGDITRAIAYYQELLRKLSAFMGRLEGIAGEMKAEAEALKRALEGGMVSGNEVPEEAGSDGEAPSRSERRDEDDKEDEEEEPEDVSESEAEIYVPEAEAESEGGDTGDLIADDTADDEVITDEVVADEPENGEPAAAGDVDETTDTDDVMRPVAHDVEPGAAGNTSDTPVNKYQDYRRAVWILETLRSLYTDCLEEAGEIADCVEKWPGVERRLRKDTRELREDAADIHSITDGILDAIEGRTDVMRVDVRTRGDDISGKIEGASDTLKADWDRVSDGMDALTDSFDAIRGTVREGRDEIKNLVEDKELYLDVSESVTGLSGDGRVLYCRNTGEVYAGNAAGGIVGSIDIDDVKDRSVDIFEKYRYLDDTEDEDEEEEEEEKKDSITKHVSALVFGCVNEGDVNAASDYAGGIAGKARYGLLGGCGSYCDVTADDGKWAGGVAGLSKLSIRDSYFFGGVSATAYVGGIAGRGENITGTRSCAYMDMEDGVVKGTGAVAGKAMGDVSDNLFVDNGYGAVDGITKTGEALGMTYQSLLNTVQLPDQFKRFTVRFVDGDNVISSGEYSYNDTISPEGYPVLSQIEGEYVYWEDKRVSPVVRNVTLHSVRRVYVPSVASERDVTENRSLLVIAGEFYPDTVLSASRASEKDMARITQATQELVESNRYVVSRAIKYSIGQSRELRGNVQIRALSGLIAPQFMFILDDNMECRGGLYGTVQTGSYAGCECDIPESGYVVEVVYLTGSALFVFSLILIVAVIILVAVLVFARKRRKRRRLVAEAAINEQAETVEPDGSTLRFGRLRTDVHRTSFASRSEIGSREEHEKEDTTQER